MLVLNTKVNGSNYCIISCDDAIVDDKLWIIIFRIIVNYSVDLIL